MPKKQKISQPTIDIFFLALAFTFSVRKHRGEEKMWTPEDLSAQDLQTKFDQFLLWVNNMNYGKDQEQSFADRGRAGITQQRVNTARQRITQQWANTTWQGIQHILILSTRFRNARQGVRRSAYSSQTFAIHQQKGIWKWRNDMESTFHWASKSKKREKTLN